MAAQGTPQNYLYDKRPSIDTHRDRSMEQYYTPSGNPYGYGSTPNRQFRTAFPSNVPSGGGGGVSSGNGYPGYTPPMISGGQWSAQPFAPRSNQFTLPGATNGFTTGYVPPPGASPYMPNFQSFQNQYQQQQPQQAQQAQAAYQALMTNPNMANYQPQSGGMQAGPANTNVSQMMQQFAAQHQNPQPPQSPQPLSPMGSNPALNNPAYAGLQRTANFMPQGMNPQGPAINPNDPQNNAALLLGMSPDGGGYNRPYAPILAN